MRHRWPLLFIAASACSSSGGTSTPDATAPDAGPDVRESDVPIAGLSSADVAKFNDGDDLFDVPFREADGLGPLYVRTSCGACHQDGSRGPGFVKKIALVEADGVTPMADQSALTWGHTVREGLAAGATTPIEPPAGTDVKQTLRVGPPVLGRGYIEAVDDAELARVEAEQAARSDGIHGVRNATTFASQSNPDPTFESFAPGDPVIGRFGFKARIATLDDFTADAFQGDMGMTTPMRPSELPNPDKLTDDAKLGVDLPQERIDRIAFYLRRIAIPARVGLTDHGKALFEQTGCAVCHVPSLRTRADYPIPQLANIDAPIYSDLLLHDMGPALADGQTDGSATSAGWRTAPLIGLRFTRNYLHDDRAQSVTDAVLAHDGEAAGARTAFQALSADDQRALIDFTSAL